MVQWLSWKITNYLNSKHKLLNFPMRKKVTSQHQRMVLKHLSTTNQLLGRYILTSIVWFKTSMKLVRIVLQNCINKNLLFCKIKVIFKSTTRLSNFFRFKDKVPFNFRSNVVYKFSFGCCSATYYGETCRLLNTRVGEHSGVWPLTG